MDDLEPHTGEPAASALALKGATQRVPRQHARRSRMLVNLATIVVTLVFSYVAFSNIDLGLAWRATRACNPLWLIASLLAFTIAALTRSARWRSLFAHGRRPTLSAVANAMSIGYFYTNILPARAGEAARVVVLTQRSAATPVEIIGTVVIERLYDVLAILVIFFAAKPWLPHVSWFGTAAIAAIVLALLIATAALVLAVYGDRPIRVILRPLRRLSPFSGERLEHTVSELTHGLSGLRHPTLALEAFVWTLLAWMATAACAYCVAAAFHLHLPFACGVLVAVAVGLSMILPSAPAAVGVFEGAALIALQAYGISHAAAFPYALILHLVNVFPFVIIGAWLLHYNSRHPRSVAEQPRTQDVSPV